MSTSNMILIWAAIIILLAGGAYTLIAMNSQPAPEPMPSPAAPVGEQPAQQAQPAEVTPMTFFVTSQNPGTGADLGGLAGADQHCQNLAEAAGAGDQTWRAYLSTTASVDTEVVNARDRIGSGPWHNANGVMIASDVSQLHDVNNISKETALSETGDVIKGRGDTPNEHDILTGSNPDGTASTEETDTTCENWTSESDGSAIVGHHDRVGLDDTPPSLSWNSSHGSRGCSLEDLRTTGGAGLLYCFAADE